MDDLLREFLTETAESLATLDVEIVRLEQNPNDPALLSTIFRLVHTVKGTCGFLGLPRLEHVAHAAENVLSKFRDGELSVTPHAVSLIFGSLDTIKMILAHLEQHEKEPDGNDEVLIAELNAMAEGQEGAAKESAPMPVFDDFVSTAPEPIVEAIKIAPEPAPKAESAPIVVKPVVQAAAPAAQAIVVDDGVKTTSVADQSIRVDVRLLENLMTTVSELVLTRNQLLQIMRQNKDSAFTLPLQRLNQVTSELQDGVMKTRMQPIGNAWAKLPRIVRDLAHELHKKIDLQMRGAETELDRQVLELIKDPLTHMVRNSADHGIELPQERTANGKAETGVILLNAYHEGGHIVIEISDDGRGLALDKIKDKILQKNLATEAELALMSEQQIMQFIFKPGFSTAAAVTSVSGRGVGMDVVRTNIEKIGGVIDFRSKPGRGSQFFIKIPLTLAIVSALIVEVSAQRFAIPQISVLELVKASDHSEHRIEQINGVPILRLRDRLLPLISLQTLLGLPPHVEQKSKDQFIVVIQAGNTTFGIIVDRIFDTEEIVVKPVASLLRNINLFSGNTILGDGSIVMILDINGIMQHVGTSSGTTDALRAAAVAQVTSASSRRQSLLLFTAGNDGAPKAVPLALVARLEEIDRGKIENSNGTMMVQYRGKLMPLIPFATYNADADKKESIPVLVFSDDDKNMGLIVDEIVDIIEDDYDIDLSSHRQGFLGTSIIAGKATDVIDAAYYLSQAVNDWFDTGAEKSLSSPNAPRVLLVDDSAFFRNLLTPLLSVSGYDVTAVEDAATALRLQEEGREFDAIISDIEMPGMNGFDFTAKIRNGGGRWSTLPILALSSHSGARDVNHGREVGFTDYVAKFDRDALLSALQQNISHTHGGNL